MALVDLPTPVPYPWGLEDSGSPSIQTATLDASGEKVGMVFNVPKTGTISRIGWRTGTVTTADDVDVRLETIGSDGFPSGSLVAAGANVSRVLANTDDNIWFWDTLATPASVTKGDVLAIVIAITFVNGNLQIAYSVLAGGEHSGVPAPVSFLGGSWGAVTQAPIFAIEYDDGSRPWIGALPLASGTALTTWSITNGTTPDEVGLRFKVPFPCKVSGLLSKVTFAAATTFACKLYEYDLDGTTLLSTLVNKTGIDGNLDHATSGAHIEVGFASDIELRTDRIYRATLLPETATAGNVALNYAVVDEAATMEALPGGDEFYATERTDAGVWTDTQTRRPFMGLLLSALDDGEGTGAAQQIFPAAAFGPNIIQIP